MTSEKRVRHVLSLSGGKDSTALAIYMKGKMAEMEYVFCDTGEELPETYEYLDKVESFLGTPIIRLRNNRQGFKDLLAARRGFLPSPQMRWCTQYLKIVPFEEYVAGDPVVSYIAIRADEAHRKGYISTKPNIRARYPFIEDEKTKADILELLENSGLRMPSYYRWRSRSGCYFCFFQQRIEWVGLLRNHPSLYEKAAAFEKLDPATGARYTWISKESLDELARPERVRQIREEAERNRARGQAKVIGKGLLEVFAQDELDASEDACIVCHL